METIYNGLIKAFGLIFSFDPELYSIILLSLKVSGGAVLIASLAGIPLGAACALRRFPGRRPLVLLLNTFMGFPPVVVGLFVYVLLSRSGPLGALNSPLIPALFTPFIIVGGILLGWFTATESAPVAVLYAAVLSFFFYREMDKTKLWHALLETGKLSAIALFCVGTASVFGWLLAYFQIPKALLQNVTSWGLGIVGVGFFIAFVFLVVGCFLDAIPAIIIVGTTLQPLAASVNMHPVSFAIIGIVALAFGLVTPPYGLCLMISCAIAKVRLRYALKDTMIMLVPMLLVLAAMIVWPEIPLIVPRIFAPDFLK